MNSKLTNTGRYKKVSKIDIKKRNRIINNNLVKGKIEFNDKKKIIKNKKNINYSFFDEYKSVIFLMLKIFACVFSLFLISVISILFINREEKIITVFGGNNEKINININYDLRIGIKDLDEKKNICFHELNKYSKGKLITINDNYEVKYELLDKIEAVTNTAYIITLKDKKYINLFIDKLKENYKVEKIDEYNISVILDKPNPYFIYYLSNIDIDVNDNKYNYLDGKYIRNDKVNNKILESISINKYDSSDSLISDFLNDKIDMFLTSSLEELRGISSYSYNLKKYRDGETYFMFFNKNNEIFKNKEIRKAISFGINKNEIIKRLGDEFYSVIDIPYLYSEVSSKYDKIGSENIIIKNSFVKQNGIYFKDGKPLTFRLIVNKNNKIKCEISDYIKEMLASIGIRIDIIKCDDEEMENNVSNNNYDLMIATVNLNEIPDIRFLYDYMNFDDLLNFDVNNFIDYKYIKNIQNLIKDEFLCVGIASRTASVITKKNIYGFDEISYNNIFKNIDNIGIIK